MIGLDITSATPAEQVTIANLVQLYIHDFSELFAGTMRGDVADDGRYVVDIPIANWWHLPDHLPLLFRLNGRLAGFALLNAAPQGDAAIDHNMAEFFVLRKYRRCGVGSAAATHILSHHPGRWEAAVMRRNTGALAFWQRVIGAHPALVRLATDDGAAVGWDGTLLHFEIAPT